MLVPVFSWHRMTVDCTTCRSPTDTTAQSVMMPGCSTQELQKAYMTTKLWYQLDIRYLLCVFLGFCCTMRKYPLGSSEKQTPSHCMDLKDAAHVIPISWGECLPDYISKKLLSYHDIKLLPKNSKRKCIATPPFFGTFVAKPLSALWTKNLSI